MFADNSFKFDENGRKLSKRIENTVGKGEIARYEQFLLFPQCFQKACFPGVSKGVVVWEWVKDPLLNRHYIQNIFCFFSEAMSTDLMQDQNLQKRMLFPQRFVLSVPSNVKC